MAIDRDQLIEPACQITGASGTNDSSLCWRELAPELNCIGLAWSWHDTFLSQFSQIAIEKKSAPRFDVSHSGPKHLYVM
jgi:hypothetical protein